LTSTDTVATHHIGRSFADTHLEDKCPCPKAACGLVPRDQVVAECGQHHWTAAKTIRQSHPAEACPGAPAEPDPLTEQQLDDIETRAAYLHEYATLTDVPLQADADQLTGEDVPALLAEVRRLRSERRRYRIAWRMARTRALSTGGAADRYAARAREGQTALADIVGALLGVQMERDEAQSRVAALEAVLAKTSS